MMTMLVISRPIAGHHRPCWSSSAQDRNL